MCVCADWFHDIAHPPDIVVRWTPQQTGSRMLGPPTMSETCCDIQTGWSKHLKSCKWCLSITVYAYLQLALKKSRWLLCVSMIMQHSKLCLIQTSAKPCVLSHHLWMMQRFDFWVPSPRPSICRNARLGIHTSFIAWIAGVASPHGWSFTCAVARRLQLVLVIRRSKFIRNISN